MWNTLKKKDDPFRWFFFLNYRVEKVGLLKFLKRPVSELLCTVNMLKSQQNCLNLHGSIFVSFFDHSEKKAAQKIMIS